MQTVADQESLERIRQVFFGLRPEEREIFLLRENGALTYEQIAQRRQCEVEAVKMQMREVLQQLKLALS